MNKLTQIVFLTGAGISAESGLATFRGNNGLWEGHKIEDVASPQGFIKNPSLVLQFYNERRTKAHHAQPNPGHLAITKIQHHFPNTQVITQNVDELHEKAGNKNVLHLHGKLSEARSSINPNFVIPLGDTEIKIGDKAPDGSQLRPNIVWFGEDVPMIEKAIAWVEKAEMFIIVGTSLNVYPAAGLIYHLPLGAQIHLVDPSEIEEFQPGVFKNYTFKHWKGSSGAQLPLLADDLINLS
jgi:NAD-dependent deacetylase